MNKKIDKQFYEDQYPEFNKDRSFTLKKDLVIPAGTIFENWSVGQKDKGEFEAVWGSQVHDDFASCLKMSYGEMKEILELNPDFFR